MHSFALLLLFACQDPAPGGAPPVRSVPLDVVELRNGDTLEGRITVEVDGVTIPRDPTRRNGWDWTDRGYGEVTLFGAACEEVEMTAYGPEEIGAAAEKRAFGFRE